jgi:hypothetical protein
VQKSFRSVVLTASVLLSVGVTIVQTCPIHFTFRAYLDRRFWQPFAKNATQLIPQRSPLSDQLSPPFAGMAPRDTASAALGTVRDTYPLFSRTFPYPPPHPDFHQARTIVTEALRANLRQEEREEVLLVEAKLDMREGEGNEEEINPAALQRARDKLLTFIKSAQSPTLRSEARGWLARVHYLLGDRPAAAKIYVDELLQANSRLLRATFARSLRMLFPYNGSVTWLVDHLEEFFDTPRHALFIVNLVTNPVYNVYRDSNKERSAMAEVGKKVLATLQNHQKLFTTGPDSEALTLALIRAALYMGEPKTALKYVRLTPPSAATQAQPEWNWLVAISHFLCREYVAAEAPLLRLYRSPQATEQDRSAAAQALVGVYHQLGRRVDELHAAFLYDHEKYGSPSQEDPPPSPPWPYTGWLIDLPYLLDIQLTEQALREYLKRYPQPTHVVFGAYYAEPRRWTSTDLVKYALAVRYARREKYAKAAALYRELGKARLALVEEAQQLYEKIRISGNKTRQLEARYEYAAFLADNSTRVFFNDTLWHGFQTIMFIEHYRQEAETPAPQSYSLPGQERALFLKKERQLRDDQEEYWRAYHILKTVVKEAGPSPLGRRATFKAIDCLANIHVGRFGRAEEIVAATQELKTWLQTNHREPQRIVKNLEHRVRRP